MPRKNATPRYDVFISYSHRDKVWVRGTLEPHLKREGLKVCIDHRDFNAGAFALTEMERAVQESRKTVAVVTQHYLDGEWTAFEEVLAATLDPAALRQRLVPIRLERVELPLRLNARIWIDMADARERPSGSIASSRHCANARPAAPVRHRAGHLVRRAPRRPRIWRSSTTGTSIWS